MDMNGIIIDKSEIITDTRKMIAQNDNRQKQKYNKT